MTIGGRLNHIQKLIVKLRADVLKKGGVSDVLSALSAALAWVEEAEKQHEFQDYDKTMHTLAPKAEFFTSKRPIGIQYWGKKDVPPKST